MESGSSLKDALFNKGSVTWLADLFAIVDSNFDRNTFIQEVIGKFPKLELKARIQWIAEVLEGYLPSDPREAMQLITHALPPLLDPTQTDDDFGSFILAPLGEYVVRNGLTKKYLKQSLATLREITMRFSMEDSMRSFLNTFPEETLAAYDLWVNDKNYHVRRLVSESTRPLLPWSRRLSLDHQVSLRYLDLLFSDRTRYVTRSVANHLNDISKKDPELVVKTLAGWKQQGSQDSKEMDWITRHSLRTIIKKGHVGALASQGYLDISLIHVIDFALDLPAGKLKRGETLKLRAEIVSSTDCQVMLDYGIEFMKANGKQKLKIFKWKKVGLRAGEKVLLIKNHLFKTEATTFKTYAGEHRVMLQVNGKKSDPLTFTLH